MASDEQNSPLSDIKPNEVLASISSPLGRTKLILGRQRLTYEQRPFIMGISIIVRTVNVGDIQHISGTIGMIFGFIHFDLPSQEIPEQIGLFWRQDAIRMVRIIQGYLETIHQGIDTSDIPVDQLVPKLLEAGVNDPTLNTQ